jgi:hypothetical protein
VHRAPLKNETGFFQNPARGDVVDRNNTNHGRKFQLRETKIDQRLGDLACEPVAPPGALEGIGDFDFRGTVYDQVTDTRAADKFAVVRPQHPQAKSVPVPMVEIGDEKSACGLRRAHTADVTHDVRIEVQRDQICKVALTQSFGASLAVSNLFIARLPRYRRADRS